MSNSREIEKKFWKAVNSDRTMMLGLSGVEEGHAAPMTAILDPDYDKGDTKAGPIWFFTSKDTGIAQALGAGHRATANFVRKGHDLFACVHGQLVPDNNPVMIDRLWSPFIAAWFEGGKTDPKLQLLRLEPDAGQIWLNENSLFAGVKMLLGQDPKKEYGDKVAKVQLG
jgi:general stress protein 26